MTDPRHYVHKIIVKDNLIYVARVMEPAEADNLARVNNLMYAENFTRTYAGCTLHVDRDGKILRNLGKDKMPTLITPN